MVVCNCRGASDRDVRTAIEAGAACLEQLERCGIGGDCLGCEDMLRDMIAECANAPCQSCTRRAPLAVAG